MSSIYNASAPPTESSTLQHSGPIVYPQASCTCSSSLGQERRVERVNRSLWRLSGKLYELVMGLALCPQKGEVGYLGMSP